MAMRGRKQPNSKDEPQPLPDRGQSICLSNTFENVKYLSFKHLVNFNQIVFVFQILGNIY